MAYSEALEQQVAMVRHLAGPAGLRFLDPVHRPTVGMHAILNDSQQLQMVLHPLVYGETFYWSPEMCDLLSATAPSLPDWTFTLSSVFCETGFAWFARPLSLPPIQSDDGPLAAVSWSVLRQKTVPGQVETKFIDHYDGEPTSIALMLSFFVWWQGHVEPVGSTSIFEGEQINKLLAKKEDGPEGFTYEWIQAVVRYICAGFCFIDQHILAAPDRRAERHAVKRLERDGWTHEPLIRVVELRRRATPSKTGDDPQTVAWSHQWVVSGHWRQQPYPSLGIVQPRWITPYVKGPEHLPLKPPRAKVFSVVR
jgi:hypothetical protein